jgi:hypothetical protein
MSARDKCARILLVLLAASATAQTFRVRGSNSILRNAENGTVEFRAPSHDGPIANSPDSFSISKYIVQGIVKDDQNVPVEGAALHIGREVAYTDGSGRFRIRFSRRGPFVFSVAKEEFISTGIYEVLSAPVEVRAESEDAAGELQIVVRRLPPQARLYR